MKPGEQVARRSHWRGLRTLPTGLASLGDETFSRVARLTPIESSCNSPYGQVPAPTCAPSAAVTASRNSRTPHDNTACLLSTITGTESHPPTGAPFGPPTERAERGIVWTDHPESLVRTTASDFERESSHTIFPACSIRLPPPLDEALVILGVTANLADHRGADCFTWADDWLTRHPSLPADQTR